jgi:YD repeat-containing protein
MHFYKHQATRGLKYLMLATVPLLMGSCTLDEPKATVDENGSVNYGRLSSITYLTAPILTFTYDSQNRITCIESNTSMMESDEDLLEISYDPLKIILTDYVDNGVAEVDTFTDITLNNQGYITSMKDHYMTSTGSEEVKTMAFTYDSNGHLTGISNDGEQESRFTWENGCLMQWDNDGTIFTYAYDTLENTYSQWCPWDGTSLLFMTNLLGKAPEKLISKTQIQDYYGSDAYETTYAYKLNSLGQISVMRYSYYGETVSYTFNYK